MDNLFPAMLYKYPGPHEIHGDKFDYTIAADEDEANEALAAGWHVTTDEAKAAAEAPAVEPQNAPQNIPETIPVDDSAPTRDELKQKADELGIDYPKNIPTERLSELVEAALAPPPVTPEQG